MRPLAEDAAADLAEQLQEARAEVVPCRCAPLCGPSPFEMLVAARRRVLDTIEAALRPVRRTA